MNIHTSGADVNGDTENTQVITSLPKTIKPRPQSHTHPFNGPFSGTTQVSRYQKCKTNLDFTEARDSEWQWHQLEHIQVHLAPDR